MLLIQTGSSYTVKFFFSDSYGALTESGYSLTITQDGVTTQYENTNLLFQVQDPVLGVSQGWIISPTLTAPSTPQPITIELFEWDNSNRVRKDIIRVKAVDIQTQITSPTVQTTPAY